MREESQEREDRRGGGGGAGMSALLYVLSVSVSLESQACEKVQSNSFKWARVVGSTGALKRNFICFIICLGQETKRKEKARGAAEISGV